MTPHGKAHLIRRINNFTSLEALKGWWTDAIGDHCKRDPSIIAAKDKRKDELNGQT
jgi:hypothetical protein